MFTLGTTSRGQGNMLYMCHVARDYVQLYSDVPDDFTGCLPPWQLLTLEEMQLLTAEREAIGALRAERDRLLVASDWTQVADAAVDRTAWAAYRSALRALPETYAGGPVEWPGAPDA